MPVETIESEDPKNLEGQNAIIQENVNIDQKLDENLNNIPEAISMLKMVKIEQP